MANPTLLEMPIARDGAKNSIPSTTSPTTGLLSQQYGWQDINSMPVQQGGKAPSRLDFNGVFNLISNILFYCQKGWQFEWDSSQAYYAGCIVKDTSDGKMYMCINDITSTTAPHSDTTNWKLWDLSMLANYLPLSGGTMTGSSIKRNVDNSLLAFFGGSANNKGARMYLYGKDQADNPGSFEIFTSVINGNRSALIGKPDNTLMWDAKDLGNSAIVAKSITTNGYVKRASGELMQWGTADLTADTAQTIDYPIPFGTANYHTYITAVLSSSTYPVVKINDESGRYQFSAKASEACRINWFAIGQ